MSEIFDFFFSQYKTYTTTDTTLEIIAVVFGFLSVWFSKLNKIWVFPTGIISTSIFVLFLDSNCSFLHCYLQEINNII